jgi:serine protease Do
MTIDVTRQTFYASVHMLRIVALVLTLAAGTGCRAQTPNFEQKAPRTVSDATSPDDISEGRQTAITRAVAAATPAVVSVNVIGIQTVRSDPFFDDFFSQFLGRRLERDRTVQGLGSGFVVSADGYIVTNDHVVQIASALDRSRITVSFYDGRSMEATLVGTDTFTDIALLKVEPEEPLDFIRFAEEETPIVGEWAIALGNPFGLFEANDPTVTVGVVSAVDRDFEVQGDHVYRDMIQTDAAINRGNSGGPLVNARAEVIGVNTFIYSQSGGSIGLGFAVPAGKSKQIVEELKANGVVDRSYYTGLSVVDINASLARALGLPTAEGVIVRDVQPGSPADEAGFQPYDVIVGMAGDDVARQQQLVARLYDFRPDDTVGFTILRDGREIALSMRLGRSEG